MPQHDTLADPYLICRSDTKLCALPLAHVVETMRALPVEALPGMPDFVLGASIVRDEVLPVVDASILLGADRTQGRKHAARFITLKLESAQTASRGIALAVDEVIGVRLLPRATGSGLAPLLSGAQQRLIDAVSLLDSQLLLILQAAQLISDDVWQRFNASQEKTAS